MLTACPASGMLQESCLAELRILSLQMLETLQTQTGHTG